MNVFLTKDQIDIIYNLLKRESDSFRASKQIEPRTLISALDVIERHYFWLHTSELHKSQPSFFKSFSEIPDINDINLVIKKDG